MALGTKKNKYCYFQLGESDGSLNLPPLPDAKEVVPSGPTDSVPILPIPKGVRPTLAKYRWLQESKSFLIYSTPTSYYVVEVAFTNRWCSRFSYGSEADVDFYSVRICFCHKEI